MDRITIEPFYQDQQGIYFWGKHVGFCGTRPNMPVNFLAGKMCQLSDEERADVIEFVTEKLEYVKRTSQNKGAFDVIDRRADTRRARQRTAGSEVSGVGRERLDTDDHGG